LRWPNGLCKLCKPGETGEIVGMIRNENPTRRFEGYLDKLETEKKIIKNVEIIGDCAFASGDLIYWDKYGYLHFKVKKYWRAELCELLKLADRQLLNLKT
jgi:hypothetical protein